jgi:hypothetical protein
VLEWNEGCGGGAKTRGVGAGHCGWTGSFLGALGEKINSRKNGLEHAELRTYLPGMDSTGETRKRCFTILTRAFEKDGSMLCASHTESADDSKDSASWARVGIRRFNSSAAAPESSVCAGRIVLFSGGAVEGLGVSGAAVEGLDVSVGAAGGLDAGLS